MNIILANSINEIEKLLTNRVTRLFIIVAIVLPFLIKLFLSKLFITAWMALPVENINFSVLDLFITIIIPLFIFIAVTYLFTSEGEKGTLFQVRPISRIELFVTKTIAICLIHGSQLVIVWLSLIVSSVIFDGSFQVPMIVNSLGAFLISWVPLIVLTVMAILLAQIVNSSVIAIASMIFLYLVMLLLPYVSPSSMYLLLPSYLDWYMKWLGNVSFPWIVQTFTYLCSTFALFFISGYYIFNRKEV